MKFWKAEDVRRFCIKYDLYTAGGNREYSRMLQFVSEHLEVIPRYIERVALDIIAHSEDIDFFDDDAVTEFTTQFANEVVKEV